MSKIKRITRSKVCPLLSIHVFQFCLGKECAWWSESIEACILLYLEDLEKLGKL